MHRPTIIGILNTTPDSFSDGGLFLDKEQALKQASIMVGQGVDVIDVGGESSRPGAKTISLEEELDRTISVIEAIASRFEVPISIDTTKPEVMAQAIKAGASWVNDISALSDDKSRVLLAKTNHKICLMHRQNLSQTMQNNPHYDDVVAEVMAFFSQKIQQCKQQGIAKNRLIIDPGFGFGKTLEHNLTLLANLAVFKKFGLPIMVGVSRKSMIDVMLGGNTQPRKRDTGSLAVAMMALDQGANIIRSHNVAQTKAMISVWCYTISKK